MPLAVGAGFFTGYSIAGVPGFPPSDGTDWLYWLGIFAVALGIIDALYPSQIGWLTGAFVGIVSLVMMRPLVPGGISTAELWRVAIALTAAGIVLTLAIQLAEPRVGAWAVVAGLCIAMGGAAVMVMSSNSRKGGYFGLGGAAALGAVAVVIGNLRGTRAVAIVALPLLAGLLVGGHYYPDPGVAAINVAVLLLSPLLLWTGMLVPPKRRWTRAIVAIVAVAVAVAAVTGPVALKAKKAAESSSSSEGY